MLKTGSKNSCYKQTDVRLVTYMPRASSRLETTLQICNIVVYVSLLIQSPVCSTALIYNVSEAISKEVRAFYNDDIHHAKYGRHGLSCFDPVVNIARHPLWGRIQVG